MNKKELSEQLRFSSPEWLYVVSWNNVLKQLFCPFRATVLVDIGSLYKGQIVMVKQVKVTAKLITVFIVDGSAYYYYHFDILLN